MMKVSRQTTLTLQLDDAEVRSLREALAWVLEQPHSRVMKVADTGHGDVLKELLAALSR